MSVAVGADEDIQSGLMALVVTVVELLAEALEREAVRRMEGNDLTDEEVERLGRQLQRLEAELEQLKTDESVQEEVDSLRSQLDQLVDDALRDVADRGINGE